MNHQTITIWTETIPYVRIGDGPVLLFLHGFWARLSCVKKILEGLSEHYTVVAPETFSLNNVKNPPTTIEACAEFTKIFCEKLNITPEVIVWHSLGSGIALEYTKLKPNNHKLVLISPIFPADYWMAWLLACATLLEIHNLFWFLGWISWFIFTLSHFIFLSVLFLKNIKASIRLIQSILRFQISSFDTPNDISLIIWEKDEYANIPKFMPILRSKPNFAEKILTWYNHDWPLFYPELATKEILDSLNT